MIAPVWSLDSLAIVMLAVAAASATRIATRLSPATGRLAVARAGSSVSQGAVEVDTEIAQLLMAVTMAGMLVPRMSVLPRACWEVMFISFTAWFGWHWVKDAGANGLRGLVGGHGWAHVLHCCAMAYMLVVPAGSVDMRAICGGNAIEVPAELARPWLNLTLSSIFAVVLLGTCLRDLLSHRDTTRETTQTAASRIAMGATMTLMLLIMN
jgi:Domain of unknown function (DUF5134)